MEDYNGERDLSFLPSNLPTGIVFVLGTRPDNIQKFLQTHKPSIEYQLPNLKREDFEFILSKRGITISMALVNQIYQAMQQNALFLSLAANELAERGKAHPGEIIRHVADNPENIFTLSMDRLGRTRRGDPLWNNVLKPILGILLAAREPLTHRQIRQIINIDADYLKGGLHRLRGLLVINEQKRYFLFHTKLYDYLRQDQNNPNRDHIFDIDEEEKWHKILANWCEDTNLFVIWKDTRGNLIEQERREYARKHYITHLYYAKDWSRLFAVLDEGKYGQAKVHICSMANAYAHDLNLGRRAAIREDWTLQEKLEHLPHLWRYTLLLSSLNSRADHYPSELFQLLCALNQIQKALDLVELLTNPEHKAFILLQIAPYLISSEAENRQILLNAHISALLIKEPLNRIWILARIVTALMKNQQWSQANDVTKSIKEALQAIKRDSQEFEGYLMFFDVLAETHQWEQAYEICAKLENIAHSEKFNSKISFLQAIIASLIKVQQWEHANKLASDVESILNSVEENAENDIKDIGLESIRLKQAAISFVNVQQWERAENVAGLIMYSHLRAEALKEIAVALLKVRQWERGYRLGIQAEEFVHFTNDSSLQIEILSVIAEALSGMQQWDQVNAISTDIENIALNWVDGSHDKSDGLLLATKGLAKVRQWERAENVASLIPDKQKQAKALSLIALALLSMEQRERAANLAIEAEKIAILIKENHEENEIISEIAKTLADAQKWEQAEKITDSLQPDFVRVQTLIAIAATLIKAKQWERAHLLTKKSEEMAHSIKALNAKSTTIAKVAVNFARMQQREEASRLATEAEEIACSLDDYRRSIALGGIAETFARAGQWEWAEKSIHLLKYSSWAQDAFRMIAVAQAQAQQLERALGLVQLQSDDDRLNTLGELAAYFAEIQDWKQVEDLLNSIDNSYWQLIALIKIVTSLAKTKRWKMAFDWANLIYVDFMKIEALGEIAASLVEEKQWEQVKLVAMEIEKLGDSIESDDRNGTHRKEISIALAKVQYWQRAEEVALLIKDDTLAGERERIRVLREIADDMAVSDYKRLLSFVESLWIRSVTRKESIQLLSLAHGLIAIKPEIGSAFFEAFAWVDTFLKKEGILL